MFIGCATSFQLLEVFEVTDLYRRNSKKVICLVPNYVEVCKVVLGSWLLGFLAGLFFLVMDVKPLKEQQAQSYIKENSSQENLSIMKRIKY